MVLVGTLVIVLVLASNIAAAGVPCGDGQFTGRVLPGPVAVPRLRCLLRLCLLSSLFSSVSPFYILFVSTRHSCPYLLLATPVCLLYPLLLCLLLLLRLRRNLRRLWRRPQQQKLATCSNSNELVLLN